ncbi:MAG TPA: ABC transporter permease [Longimicrobiales bacterium]|nr:ABC transporter permease [Longimicrobiales bacterium]
MAGARAYRALLRLLPHAIRSRFGRDMEEVFLMRLAEARSPVGKAWVWVRAAVDVAAVGAREGWMLLTMMTRGRGGGMDGWMQDLRYAVRTLGRSTALTLLVVGTLALGIGTSTATFSVVNGVMLKPLPYAEPDRLVAVWPEQNFNTAMVRQLLAAAPALESATGISGWAFTLTGEGEPLQVDGARVSPDHFRVLGVRPALGRDFTAEEGLPGNEGVAVISHGLWVRAFGADPSVIGRTIDLATNDLPRRTVIGVLPPDFRPVHSTPEVWVPLVLAPTSGIASDSTWYVNDRVGRLAPGATVEQATEQVRAFARDVHALMDQAIAASTVEVAGVRPLRSDLAGDLGAVIWVALGAVSLVLLIACANVANLLLARGEARQADLTVRAALGAGRKRVVRLLLVESALLGVIGGGLGIALSFALVRTAMGLAPSDFPRLAEIGVDGAVLAYGLAVTAAATVLAGLVPALRVSRANAPSALGGWGRSARARRSSRLATTLVGAEVALAMVVVIASGLMLRSLHSMTSEDPGLDGRGVLVLRPSPPEGRYPSGLAYHAYYDQVLERVRALPAVERASAIHLLPGTGDNWNFPTFIEGVEIVAGQLIPTVNFRVVWPEYFETVGVSVLQGRSLARADDRDAELAVVVNQAFVERYWPGEEPLGRELRLFSTEAAPHRVVGVVQDTRQHGLSREPLPEMYFTHAQIPWNMAFWIVARVRGDEDPLDHASDVRAAVWSVDPDVPIRGVDALARVMDASAATTRFVTVALGAFGALALLLSAVGVFGVTAYDVGRRIPEFGVRVALGASRGDVVRSALAGSLWAVTLGLGAGVLAASFATDALAAALYEIEPSDPATFLGVAGLLLVVAVVAALVPAWRAGRVDPVRALRGEGG